MAIKVKKIVTKLLKTEEDLVVSLPTEDDPNYDWRTVGFPKLDDDVKLSVNVLDGSWKLLENGEVVQSSDEEQFFIEDEHDLENMILEIASN